jgi:hypothetical protein
MRYRIDLDTVVDDLYVELPVDEGDTMTVHSPDADPEKAVTITLVKAHGPAGGWPVLRYEGELGPLLSWLATNYCGGSVEQVRDLLDLPGGFVPVPTVQLVVTD